VNPNPHLVLASIVVPCWNQRGFTELCLRALFRHTRPAWELIVIDNGSTDDTVAYLSGVRDAASVPVTIIRNPENVGFPRAINQGLQVARGEYLVLLNNDAVVTDGWLDQLIALTAVRGETTNEVNGRNDEESLNTKDTKGERLGVVGGLEPDPLPTPQAPRSTSRIGLVGPMSNYAAPPQGVEEVPYRDLDEMHDFARRWRDRHRGQWFTAAKLSGFCLLLTRAVYEAIGGLDERFGLGFFDDDDLAVRARRAGFELAVARDLFVHHFGSRTFTGNGVDASALLEANARRFAEKWGPDVPQGRRVELRPFEPSSRTREQEKLRVTLTMIVRDEESNLPKALESVRGIFDEIVVVDTGSTDRTAEVARSFGARVFDFVWVDDFAAARNAALARATGDYAFWLDADDVVEPHEREKLRALLGSLRPDEDRACVVRCACDPGEDGSGGETVVDHIRLFPLREGIRWTYRVHEQILPALRRANIPVRWTDLTVRHTGIVPPDLLTVVECD
jgi:GT2 family glycosyltransferase